MPLPETERLLAIMATLRNPKGGCPWDLEQNFASIAPYTIEEAYEVADAIARGHMADLREELGDLLLQVVFHAQMANEEKLFTFEEVAKAINEKMLHRHPHVFGDAAIASAAAQTEHWEQLKAQERANKKRDSTLSDVAVALPGLMRAQKLQSRAARVGFDWPDVSGVLNKIDEERTEVRDAIATNDTQKIAEEIGDLLFAVVNLARFMGMDAETALRGTNEKFIRRFTHVETCINAQGRSMNDATLEEMEALWQEAKQKEAA